MSANITIITMEDFNKFKEDMLKALSVAKTKEKKQYITKQECLEEFGIKDRTLVELWNKREVTFSKVGNTYIYKYTSILDYLEKNEIEAINS